MHIHSFRHRILRQRRFRQMLFGSILLSVLFAFIIVPIERSSPIRKIDSFSDGLWWAIQTATTVGYGDEVPVTDAGRFIGLFMQLLGTVMFGSLIAIISSSMGRNQEEMYWNRLFERLDYLNTKIEKMDKETKYLVRSEVDTEHKKN